MKAGVDQQQLRGFHSLSSVIASLEQRYLNGFEVDEKEDDVVALPIREEPPAKKKQRTRNRKLKATKEEEKLLLDGEGFIDDTEIADEIEDIPVAGTNATPTSGNTPAMVDLTKLIPVKTHTRVNNTTLQSPTKPTAAAAANQTRSQFLMQYLGEFNGNAQVCEKMFALTHCIREELLDAEHHSFQFSPQVESLLLEIDALYLKQQPVRSKGYLAHLLSLFPSEVTRDVLVAHLQRILLKDKLTKQERKVDVRIKWVVDACRETPFVWNGQNRGSAYLLGEACRQAKRTRDRLEVWLLARKRELAQFSPHRAYRSKPKPMYSTYAMDKILHQVPQLVRAELKLAMEEFPADHYFWNQVEGKYVPFKVPISAKAAAAAAAADQAATVALQQQSPTTAASEAVVAPAATVEDKKLEEDAVAAIVTIKEVFAPCKGKRYQKVQFKAEDFAPKSPAATVLQLSGCSQVKAHFQK